MEGEVQRGAINVTYDCDDRVAVWKKYSTSRLKCVRATDASNIWMIYSGIGQLCDEHIMQGGLSGIVTKEGDQILPLLFRGRVADYADDGDAGRESLKKRMTKSAFWLIEAEMVIRNF